MLKLIQHDILEIEKLLIRKKVVAIGEVGLDRHYYDKTKYPDYKIDEEFIKLQKEYLRKQIEFAAKYKSFSMSAVLVWKVASLIKLFTFAVF